MSEFAEDEDQAFELALGKLVSNRNHFTGSEEYAALIFSLVKSARAKNLTDEQVLNCANTIAKKIISGTVWAFSTAARNGIEQAAKLMGDTKYNKALSARHEREIEKQKQWNEQQETEHIVRKSGAILHVPNGRKVQ